MITTLFLDLDDTLLGNPNKSFLPAYFQVLARRLAPFMPPDQFVTGLRAATAAMLSNTDPRRTMQQVFEAAFAEFTGREISEAQALINAFYRNDFPELAPVTETRPAAREVVEWAANEGLQVVIATNPVYPQTAIEQRLDWAGISPHEYDFAFVPSYDRVHFGKPHPAYYAELLARTGKRPTEAVMVGDDWTNDIVPAASAGMNTFWIAPREAERPATWPQPDGQGTLDDFLRWVRDARCLETLQPLPPTPASLLAGLGGNLAAFHSMTGAVRDWKRQPGPGEWSLTEILCHLRDAEIEVNLPRLERIATQPEPFVPAADTDPWAAERNYQAQDGEAALGGFAQARMTAIDFLRQQPEDYWQRTARHSILGRTTPAELVMFTLEHDRIHLTQIAQLEPN